MKLANTVTNITKNNKGFSLLEVLVGVSIIGIISAIAVPTYNQYRSSATLTATDSSLINSAKAYNLCVTQSDPTTCTTLSALNIDCADCEINANTTNTQICINVTKTIGGSTLESCWDSDDREFVYGGGPKFCHEKTATPAVQPVANTDIKKPLKICNDVDECGGVSSGNIRRSCIKTAKNGTCAAGVCS